MGLMGCRTTSVPRVHRHHRQSFSLTALAGYPEMAAGDAASRGRSSKDEPKVVFKLSKVPQLATLIK